MHGSAGKNKIGLTAGASAPEYLVEEVIQKLEALGAKTEEVSFIQEDVSFSLPLELTKVLGANATSDLPISR
jgi:4-hydroxy-3-methylbut-2-enyl diphosphate reductase